MGTRFSKRISIILIGLAVSCWIAFIGRTQTRDAQAAVYTRYGWAFYLKDEKYGSDLVRSNILSAPKWDPSKALPLDAGKAVEVARSELAKLVDHESEW